MILQKSIFILAQLNWEPLWEDHGIPLAIMGLVVVFAALTLLRVFIGLLPRLMAAIDRIYPEQKAATATPPAPKPSADEMSEEIVAVISAAVAATVAEPHRVVQIQDASAEGISWSLEGRLQHHASHRIQPRDPK